MENTQKENLKQEEAQTYYDFITNIYRHDEDNFVYYEKVDGLIEAMFQIYEGGVNTKHLFLMKCIVKEINKVLRKLEKKSK
jgi:hypothetical protein